MPYYKQMQSEFGKLRSAHAEILAVTRLKQIMALFKKRQKYILRLTPQGRDEHWAAIESGKSLAATGGILDVIRYSLNGYF